MLVEQFDRAEPQADAAEALVALHQRLSELALMYQQPSLGAQRGALAEYMMEVHSFLRSQGFSVATLAPLNRPAMALLGIDENKADPLFTKKLRGGAPKLQFNALAYRGILAALGELWLTAHKADSGTKASKLAKAANAMNGPFFGEVTKRDLQKAMKDVREGASEDVIVAVATMYGSFLARLCAEFGAAAAFRLAVRQLNDHPPSDLWEGK